MPDERWIPDPPADGWRRRMYVVIFRHDSRPGRAFDVALLIAIAASVAAVMLESVDSVRRRWGDALYAAEWAFTLLFTVEYAARVLSVRRARQYVLSPLGLIDLLAILPTYLSLVFGGAQTLAVVRGLRLLRVFRVLKLPNYVSEATTLGAALRTSRRKITVFVTTVLTLVVIVGTLAYLIEGPENGFTNIPVSVYWAIVTLTTVGYGDIAPRTPAGRLLASAVMILGYGIIAVPTGIVTAELVRAEREGSKAGGTAGAGGGGGGPKRCPGCGLDAHDADAAHCKRCGTRLVPADATAAGRIVP